MHGFVEHLEWEESYFEPHPPDSEQDMEGGGGGEGEIDQVRRQLKEDIVNLLILCVSKPTLNIAHLLLGFLEIQDTPRGRLKKISETILQDPGEKDWSPWQQLLLWKLINNNYIYRTYMYILF